MAKTVKSSVKKETKTAKAPVKAKAAAAPKAPVVKKTAARKAPVAAAPAKKPAAPKKTTRKKVVTGEERFRMVQEAAYYIAERNGFAGDDQRYWSEAEATIDALVVTK